MNLLLVILLLVALQGAYSACPNSIILETSDRCPDVCKFDLVRSSSSKCNQAQSSSPKLNQMVEQDASHNTTQRPAEPRHLVSWAAQLCGLASALIVLQFATSYVLDIII